MDAVHECKRCGYASSRKGDLKKHLAKKIACPPLNCCTPREELLQELTYTFHKDHECDICGKHFATYQSKSVHLKLCKQKYDYHAFNQDINEIKALIIGLANKPTSITNITNTNTQTNNNQINNYNFIIRDFGNENMAALPPEFIGDCFISLNYRDLIDGLHFDPAYPENNNIGMGSLKRGTMRIYRNGEWSVVPINKGVRELLLQSNGIFKRYVRENKNDMIKENVVSEEELMELQDTIEDVDNNESKTIKPIHKEIETLLETNKGQLPLLAMS